MWAVQVLGPVFYRLVMDKPYVPLFNGTPPGLKFGFDLAIWVFGFGYLMGVTNWQRSESDYQKTISSEVA